jgi:hypothetical protein
LAAWAEAPPQARRVLAARPVEGEAEEPAETPAVPRVARRAARPAEAVELPEARLVEVAAVERGEVQAVEVAAAELLAVRQAELAQFNPQRVPRLGRMMRAARRWVCSTMEGSEIMPCTSHPAMTELSECRWSWIFTVTRPLQRNS